ncbi:hypothetical protein [Rhodococcus koreensis]|uniref:hypothetical protein n=1 Tax=Rhodococcus koreensis TaxID=99653 RepID=UPI003672C326
MATIKSLNPPDFDGFFLRSVDTELTKRYTSVLDSFQQISSSMSALASIKIPDITLGFQEIAKQVTPGLEAMRRALRRRYPQNWPDDLRPFSDESTIRLIVQDEGIPLAYIPRPEIVSAVVEAENRKRRIDVLLGRREDIIDDCLAVLDDEALHRKVEAQVPLMRDALYALRDGHTSAAQALAIVVCDTLICTHIADSHTAAKRQAGVVLDDLELVFRADYLRIALAIAPVVGLLTSWTPKSPYPAPSELSRHVTIHQATPDHLRPDNALIAVMMGTSLLLAFSELAEWRDARERKPA